ncbi:hypothetical protein M573_122031 [Prevotella intermedia ZT]|uniref:Uncharacterized protein n=1 Tax=Prevotella intermedia ZT TaxID=1347790 RepID=A0AAP0V2I0_PREIN|nr:hypothetical protein M573_122031 [Prevotella intermedia ZT]
MCCRVCNPEATLHAPHFVFPQPLKYLYRKSILFLPFSKSVGFALQNSRFYLAKPTLLQCKTIGFGTPNRSC